MTHSSFAPALSCSLPADVDEESIDGVADLLSRAWQSEEARSVLAREFAERTEHFRLTLSQRGDEAMERLEGVHRHNSQQTWRSVYDDETGAIRPAIFLSRLRAELQCEELLGLSVLRVRNLGENSMLETLAAGSALRIVAQTVQAIWSGYNARPPLLGRVGLDGLALVVRVAVEARWTATCDQVCDLLSMLRLEGNFQPQAHDALIAPGSMDTRLRAIEQQLRIASNA